jgi:thiol-disulfide isomerase/thioredoxin
VKNFRLPAALAALVLAALAWNTVLSGAGSISDDVQARLARNDFAGAAADLQNYRRVAGNNPEAMEAMSWMARGELARRNFTQAEKWAQDTYALAAAEWKKHPVRQDPNAPLALALGASIEVQGAVLALSGQRADAVTYLTGERQKYYATPLRARIQKVINELSLEGKPAPPLAGVVLPKGKPAFVFFWAHWCPDCKAEKQDLVRLKNEFAPKGLVFVAPTQKYGYVAGGEDATPAVETRYIEQVRKTYYTGLIDAPAIVNEENFRVWGASTTPTLALIDRNGIVRMYHPGAMPYAELRARIAALF